MRRALLVTLTVVGLLLIPAAAANTPAPLTVTVAGSLQFEAGCSAPSPSRSQKRSELR